MQTPSPNRGGLPIIAKTQFQWELALQPPSGSASALPLVTSLLGMSKCKMQKPANNDDAA